jgi:aminoglycoside phosphotransferase (APT) family kinase protein
MIDALLAALKERPRFAALTSEDLEPLPATGTAHGHVRLPDGLIARVAYAYEGDAGAAARLDTQAAAFRLMASSHCTPLLHDVLPPRLGLPGGALIVDRIVGRAPLLPRDLGAIATSLAAMHSVETPTVASPIPHQKNPFLETLEIVEQGAMRFLDKAVQDPGARAEIADELQLIRGMALTLGKQPQPLTIALADTHPGNFIVDSEGIAWFVDLEKVHVGSPAIDLAHATLPTSTLWHPDVGQILSQGQVAGFYAQYLARVGEARAAELEPWLMPMRRLTWLRTTMFMARWRVQTGSPRDPNDPGQWSDAGLEPAMKAHLQARIDQCFEREAIRAIRAEWL